MHKSKILILFPKYSPDDASHYSYWYPIFSQAGKNLDIRILFETPSKSVKIKNTYVLDTPNLKKPINLLYRSYQIAKQMILGYKKIYIHYSYSTFFITKFLSIFSNAKIYYWNCEYYNSINDSDKILPIILKFTDYLVTGSQMIGNRYKKIFTLNKPIRIISNYVSKVSSLKNNLSKNKVHILFVHHISPRKGSKELPDIVKHTLNLIPNSRFHIIGDGPDLISLKSKIQNLKLESTVRFYGSMSRDKVTTFFKSCDIFIMPSRSEGFPRVILEAMIYKIPFVSTDVGNVRELVGEMQKKYLISVCKSKLFAKMIQKLYLSGSNTKMINENHKKALEYNLEKSINQYIECFK